MFRPALALALALAAAAPAFAQDGKATYDLQCKLCHDDETLGPSLVGIEGRKVGGGSYDYSPELKAKGEAGETWTDANLDAFLKNPSAYAPGAKMSMSVTDDAARAAVIAYIKSLK